MFRIHVLALRCRDMPVDVYFQRTFDQDKHSILIEALRDIGLDGRYIRIIVNVYWNQTSTVNSRRSNIRGTKYQKRSETGCILSLLPFIVYSERICRNALSENQEEIIVNRKVINNLRYANDTDLLVSSEEDLQIVLETARKQFSI